MYCLNGAEYYKSGISETQSKNPLMNVKLSFTVGKGENFGFLYPNGASKTTIICILDRESYGCLGACTELGFGNGYYDAL
jgi:ABC-type uncharacterized transport system ATPase subunit